MWISDLALNDFRSYDKAVLSLSPGVTVFLGENGHGKTNLVEAVAYLSTFSSHRVAADVALVRQGASAGVIRARTHDGDSSAMVEIEIISGKANRARLNRGAVKPRELLGLVKTVVFAPEDLDLIQGDPSSRRRFLDDILIQHRPRFAQIKSEYDKVLRHRSALLKAEGASRRRGGTVDETSFEIWDERLASLGAELTAARVEILGALRPYLTEAYADIAPGRGVPNIAYRARVEDDDCPIPEPAMVASDPTILDRSEERLTNRAWLTEHMIMAMKDLRSKELDRGVCLVGPHRDDVQLGLGTLKAKGYASHGETWSYALSLRLASWQLLKELDGSDPILILDDVFAELDSRRRARLAEIVATVEQVLITTAVGDDIPEELNPRILDVRDGTVESRD